MFSSAMPRGASLWHADGQNPHEMQFYAKLNLHKQSGYKAGTDGGHPKDLTEMSMVFISLS